jgi:asparagine synthase (glutamine-hydrolysing)
LQFGDYTAIHHCRIEQFDLRARAMARNQDLAYRPWKDGLALRLHCLQLTDPGNYLKAYLGRMQVDYRDPTADVRLLEFCFGVPTEHFLRGGMLRALARRALVGRLPKQVLEDTRSGLQVADWHEDLTADRKGIIDELDRLEACPAAAAAIDLMRLRRWTENWPSHGWEQSEALVHYRHTLLNAVAAGHFLRRATGSNL